MPPLARFLPQEAAAKKESAAAEPAYALSGTLFLSRGGWLMLTVPNAIVRGVFAAMIEPGLSLPRNDEGELDAHISVMRPEEVEQLGGPAKISPERGKRFAYTLGRLETFVPPTWPGITRIWAIHVHSPALQLLRRSYGLSPIPKNGEYPFHITVAVRRSSVLGRNETSKSEGGE